MRRMDDSNMCERIGELEEEERERKKGPAGEPLSAGGMERLRKIEVELDQCWDLLRPRRARRSAGQDPDPAPARPETVVEKYQQCPLPSRRVLVDEWRGVDAVVNHGRRIGPSSV